MAENLPKLFIVSFLFVVIATIMAELRFRIPGTRDVYFLYMERISAGTPHSAGTFLSFLTPISIALVAVLFLISGVVRVGFISYCLKAARGTPGGYKDIFNGFLLPAKVLSILIISTILIIAWSILFVFPGAAAYYRYRQAYYILLDDPGKSALQCIRESKLMMRGHKVDLFVLDLSFIGWYLLSVLITGITLAALPFSVPAVSIWLSPYTGLSRAAFYDRLLDRLAV